MLRKQYIFDDSHYDMPLIYYIEGHSLHFGHPEFALITGLPFGTLEKSRKRAHSSFRVSSSVCTTDIISKKWLKNEVISDLNVRVFKRETIIQVLARERNEEYHEVLQFNEEFSSLGRDFMDSLNILFHDSIQPHYSDEDISNDFVVKDELRLCLEDEEKMRLEQKKNTIEEQRFRVEEAKRMRLEEDKLLQIDDQQGQVKCKFPWSDDYIVGRNFWLTLTCLDPSRKGWLCEEILLQNSTPLFYANGDKYATSWSDVDQECLPAILVEMKAMNDPEEFYDALFCLRDDKRDEYNTLMTINDVIAEAEEKLTTKGAHIEIMKAEINPV
ncbi:hypothetical protein Tco_0694304 [Tanacetum coccineum]